MSGSWWWLALAVLVGVVACDLPTPAGDWDRVVADLNESAVALFVLGRAERGMPDARLEYRAGGIYSSGLLEAPDGPQVWQVRQPRADVIQLPLTARDRLARVDTRADVQVRFDQRYCRLPTDATAPVRCQAWQETICCNRIWLRSRGEWRAEMPTSG